MTLENAYEDRQLLDQSEHLDIVRKGYLRKLKKNKRRYFVLRSFSRQGSGRLECYGSEKKFKEGNGHGRTILISEMFNFAEMSDQESSLTFAIFLKDEKYVLGAELLEDRENWLEALSFVKNQGMMQGKLPKYEFIWKIHIKDQGIARGTFLCGDRRLGKMDSTLCFLKGNSDEVIEEIQLCNVRQSGQADSFLLLEIGRSHPLGPGELWIEAQNKAAAEYMYTVLFSSSLVRPRSYVSSEVARPVSKDMTNRRRSDGADKTKPSKRSFLPFLRSKLKETEAYAEKSFQANQKRSMSAADIRRVGVNQNGDLFNKLFSGKTEQTTGSSSSISETRKDSISSKKSRRLSLFRGKKHQKSMSVQDLHKVDQQEKASDISSRCNSNVSSLLKQNYDYCLSRSVQNIHTLASSSHSSSHSSSPTPSQSSGRLANIKKLSEMKSTSDIYMSRLAEKDPVIDYDGYRRVVPNGRPVTMLVNDGELTPVLRKNKWKSLDGNLKDSPAESSEDCSSVGSFESDRPQLSSKETTDATPSPLPLVDEGYMCMNYNNNDDISNAQQLGRNSMYVLVQPDANIPKYEEIPEEYMDMSPGNQMDFDRVLNVVQKSTGVSSEENALEHSPEQERCHDDAQKISGQGAGSSQSSGSDVDKPIPSSPISPEKRRILRDFRKQMTLNWKASPKKTPEKQSPKKRYSEATSHFYVDTFPACDTEEKPVHEMEDFKTGFQSCDEKKAFDSNELWSGKLNKQRDVPPRPNHLDLKSDSISDSLSTVAESSCEMRDGKSANICPIVKDDDIDLNSEIVSKHSPESKQIAKLDSCLQSKKSKHQKLAFVGNNNSVVYTEVTLKEKSCADMPGAKGARKISNSDEQRGGSPASKKNGRKISQKILSSPTSAEGKGYENISLRDGVITTPLEEVEGRPYVNLGFHQNATGKSKKGNSGKRSSGDDAALRQLMALQSGRKMDSEVATRSKSLGDSSTDDNDSAVDNAEADFYEEVAYVNVSKENKGDYAFNHGDVARIVARNARQSATSDDGDDCTYENLYNHNQARSRKSPIVNTPDLDANAYCSVENVETKQIFRQSPTSKQKPSCSDVYTNIDENYESQKATEKLGDEINRMKLNDEKRPIPAPRPKKNDRRKASRGIENESAPKDLFQKPNHSPKQNYCRPGSPQKGETYVNVGSYRDNFDAIQPNPLAASAAKSRSYENLADEFPVRRNAKISVDWSLAYAQVEITGNVKNGKGNLKKAASFEENCEGSYADIDITKKPDSNKNSPQSDQESSPRAKHYAYSEVDFKKSQGISEAVRGRRAESGADSSEQEG